MISGINEKQYQLRCLKYFYKKERCTWSTDFTCGK